MKRLIGLLAILVLVTATALAGGGRERNESTQEEEVTAAETAETVEQNKMVQIHYEGSLDDGTVFDSSEGGEPLEFIFGVGMLIPGLESQMEGMAVGDRKTVRVEAEDAYGPYVDEALQEIPRNQIPAEIDLVEGMQLAAQTPQGPIPVTVHEIREETVIMDFNHPLAGEALTFEIEVMTIRDATEEELEPFGAPMPPIQQ